MSENPNANTVTLPREVSEAIDGLRKLNHGNSFIVGAALGDMQGSKSSVIRRFFTESDGNFDTLLAALVNGYEVEKSPEELEAERHERVRRYFRDVRRVGHWDKAIAVKRTLKELGIKIEGVNADE